MNIDPEFVSEVERLRKVVFDLLLLISRSALIDDIGNREIIADDKDTRLLQSCDMAAAFAAYDIDPSAYSIANEKTGGKK